MVIEAALAGLGVALVPRFYVEAELAQGLLVAPWPGGKTIAKTFCIILPAAIELNEWPLQVFTQWMLEEVKTCEYLT